jgi:hypothetical protein
MKKVCMGVGSLLLIFSAWRSTQDRPSHKPPIEPLPRKATTLPPDVVLPVLELSDNDDPTPEPWRMAYLRLQVIREERQVWFLRDLLEELRNGEEPSYQLATDETSATQTEAMARAREVLQRVRRQKEAELQKHEANLKVGMSALRTAELESARIIERKKSMSSLSSN